MADLGDIGISSGVPVQQIYLPSFKLYRPSGMVVNVPALDGAIVYLAANGLALHRVRAGPSGANFYDLSVGNFTAVVTYGPGTGSAWSIVVTPSSYTVTRLGGGGVTGYIAVG